MTRLLTLTALLTALAACEPSPSNDVPMLGEGVDDERSASGDFEDTAEEM